MKLENFIIRDANFFKESKRAVGNALHTSRRLPNQVFQSKFQCFAFEEFDWIIGEMAWPCLQALGKASKDTSLLVAVLDPDPESYFKRHFSVYNWAKVSLDAAPEMYWGILNQAPEDSPTDSIWINSEVVVWIPDSESWAIWGERSRGICVLATKDSAMLQHAARSSSWRTADAVLESVLPNTFADRKVPASFDAPFRSNFERR